MACISETAPACKTQLVKRFSPPVVAVSPCYIFIWLGEIAFTRAVEPTELIYNKMDLPIQVGSGR
jgi:hypothetical protein